MKVSNFSKTSVGSLTSLISAACLFAEPSNPSVVSGSAQFQTQGNHTDIKTSQNAIINYDQFNLNQKESVRFIQPNDQSRVLNRILSNTPTHINGSISANGRVFFANPAGVVFGKNAVINAGHFTAAAGNITNQDFLSGMNKFSLDGKVTNHGEIKANRINLLGQQVENIGSLVTGEGGLITLSSGDEVLLGEEGSQIYTKVQKPTQKKNSSQKKYAVSNKGSIKSKRGRVNFGAGDRYAMSLQNKGTIEAKSVQFKAKKGVAHIGGEIKVSASENKGGRVEVLAEKNLITGIIDASGKKQGGKILIGGDYLGGKATQEQLATLGIQNEEKNLPTSNFTTVSNTAQIDVSSSEGSGGKAIIWSDDTTRFYGTADASGKTRGGFIETSGAMGLDAKGSINVSSLGKAGTWLLDPYNIRIIGSGSTNGVNSFTESDGTNYFDSIEDSTLLASDIESVLNSGGNVSLITGPAPFGVGGNSNGRITIETDITKTSGGDATLSFYAANLVNLQSGNHISSSSGKLHIYADSNAEPSDNYGWLNIEEASSIFTNGGNFEALTESFSIQGIINTDGGNISITDHATEDFNASEIGVADSRYTGNWFLNAGSGDITLSEQGSLKLRNHAIQSNGGRVSVNADIINFTTRFSIPKIQVATRSDLSITARVIDPSRALTEDCDKEFGDCFVEALDEAVVTPPPTNNRPPTRNTHPDFVLPPQITSEDGTITKVIITPSYFIDDGGSGNITLSAPNLPSGVTATLVNGNLEITGTVAQIGRHRFDIIATDAGGLTSSFQFVITRPTVTTPPVDPPTPTDNAPTINSSKVVTEEFARSSDGLVNYTVGTDFFVDDNGLNNLTLSVSNLPAGLSARFVNGRLRITGILRRTGNYTLTVRATDSNGQSVTRAFPLTYNAPTSPPVDPPTPPVNQAPQTLAGNNLGVQRTSSGSVHLVIPKNYFSDDNGSQNLTLSTRTLPDGVQAFIQRDKLVLSGQIRQAGRYAITIIATDAGGLSTTKRFEILYSPNTEASKVEPRRPLPSKPTLQPSPKLKDLNLSKNTKLLGDWPFKFTLEEYKLLTELANGSILPKDYERLLIPNEGNKLLVALNSIQEYKEFRSRGDTRGRVSKILDGRRADLKRLDIVERQIKDKIEFTLRKGFLEGSVGVSKDANQMGAGLLVGIGLTLSDVVNPKNLLDLTKAVYGVNKQMEQIQAHLFDGNIVALKNDLTKLANQAGATKAQIQDLYHQLEALPSLSDYDKGKMIGSLGAAFAPSGGAIAKIGKGVTFIKPIDRLPKTRKMERGAPKTRAFFGKADFDALPNGGTIDPSKIRFSQNNIRGTFKDGGNVDDLVAGLKNGSVDPSKIPAIRIVEKDGMIFTLDNRRLHAFQQAGIDIRFQKLPHIPKKQHFKFTTTNDGVSIDVR